MQWIVITASDLDDYLVAAQAEAIRQTALATGQADRFTSVMPAVVARVRAEIMASGKYQVSATAHSVPPELKQAACTLIAEAMQSGIPGLELTDDQRRMADDARDLLRRIAEGKLPVSAPDDPLVPTSAQSGGSIQVVSSGPRRFTRDSLSSL